MAAQIHSIDHDCPLSTLSFLSVRGDGFAISPRSRAAHFHAPRAVIFCSHNVRHASKF
jgi:hypothetical protein